MPVTLYKSITIINSMSEQQVQEVRARLQNDAAKVRGKCRRQP